MQIVMAFAHICAKEVYVSLNLFQYFAQTVKYFQIISVLHPVPNFS